MPAGKFKDVEFQVTSGTHVSTYSTFASAAAMALDQAIARGSATLDVLVWSEAGARALGGDALARYREDPEASVFDRYEIKVNAVGRVP